MKIEVIIRVTKPEGYSAITLAESSRTLVMDDDDFRATRRAMADAANDSVDEVEDRLRHLARAEEEKADE